MNITILQEILSYTRRHGSSGEHKFIHEYLKPAIEAMGYSYTEDAEGNIWVEVESPDVAPYLFVAHIDTCHRVEDEIVKLKEDSGILSLHPDSETVGCLGADDGVGIYASLSMMDEGVGGTYLFTRGEEVGLLGANYIATQTPEKLTPFSLCIEVDRAGTLEIITEQATGKCASTEFAEALAAMLDMKLEPSDQGVYTDNSEFNQLIPECVNLAAGYYSQHTSREIVDLLFVQELVDKLCKLDYSQLPIVRAVTDVGSGGLFAGYYAASALVDDTLGELDTFDTMLEFVYQNPDEVAAFLVMHGVDEYEILSSKGETK